MAKKKKKPSALAVVSEKKKKFSVKRALILLLSSLAAFILYEAILSLESKAGLGFSIIMPVYFLAAIMLFCAVFFFNRGFSNRPITPEALSEEGVGEEDIPALTEKLSRHRIIARRLMLILVPIIIAILLDTFYLFYGDFFEGVISALFSKS